ncbi:RNA-splicing factor [Recurvomyces mirabilis]|nr:RNA-splicing factor [Recurvomyces mirabilis]
MTDNVGLTTPRGSGTSGYVQRNLSHLRPRDNIQPYPKDTDSIRHRQRQPDQEILEHDRKREIEVKVFELRDRLEDEGVDEDEIDDKCEALRKDLTSKQRPGEGGPNTRKLKSHQVHELAKAKIEESEKLRRALGISKDYEEGSHWKRQEERKVEREKEVAKGPEVKERGERRERDNGRRRGRDED